MHYNLYILAFLLCFSAPYLVLIAAIILRRTFSFVAPLFRGNAEHLDIADDGDVPGAKAIVWLIHGTFAKNASWTRGGSSLRKQISASVNGEVAFRVFSWSGKNSIRNRSEARKRLSKELEESIANYPKKPHFLIGHSHGGTIALKSICSSETLKKSMNLISLSTPFLVARARPKTQLVWTIAFLFPLVLLFWIGSILEYLGFLQFRGGLALFTTIAGTIVCGIVEEKKLQYEEWIARECTYCQIEVDQALIIRSSSDEVGWLFGFVNLTSHAISKAIDTGALFLEEIHESAERVSSFLAQRMYIIYILYFIGFCSLYPLEFASPEFERQLIYFYISGSLILFAISMNLLAKIGGQYMIVFMIIVGGIVFAPIILCLILISLVAGPELALVASRLEITAESTPPGKWQVVNIGNLNEEDSFGRLRTMQHSMAYLNPEALRELGEWIAKRVS